MTQTTYTKEKEYTERLASAERLGAICGLSARTIKRLAAQGVLTSYPVGVRCVLFDVEESIKAIKDYSANNDGAAADA